MKIRQANISDLSAIVLLFDQYRVFYRKESAVVEAEAFLKARMEEKSSVIFVAENEEADLCGFCQLYPLFSSTQMQRFWLLNDLFVSAEARGKGTSKLLIERVKVFCAESDAAGFYLETEKSNEIGNRLYERAGMTLDADHNYYSWSTGG